MQKEYDKTRKRTKVTITEDDLKSWGLEDLDPLCIQKWIKSGIKNKTVNKTVSEKLSKLEDKIDRLAKMNAYYLHNIYLRTSINKIDDTATKETMEKMISLKKELSKLVTSTFFPLMNLRDSESETLKWIKEQNIPMDLHERSDALRSRYE